jgi:hypothetical protein
MEEFGKSPFLQWVFHEDLKASGSARLFYWVLILSTANKDSIHQQKYLSCSLWPTISYSFPATYNWVSTSSEHHVWCITIQIRYTVT